MEQGTKPKRKMPIGRRFQPGQSGNPGGRPKDFLSRLLRETTSDEDARTVVETLRSFAKAGKIEHIREFWDRFEGKVPQPQQVGGDPDAPVRVVIEYVNDWRAGE